MFFWVAPQMASADKWYACLLLDSLPLLGE